ncbi:MAG: glycosyltransferase [Phycisphaerales bacterium JB041]
MVDKPHQTEPERPDRRDQPGAHPRFALAHDWLCGYRGGEAVLERIASLAQRAGGIDTLYTMFDDGRSLAPTTDLLPRCVSPLGRLPGSWRRWLLPLYPLAVGSLSGRLRSRQRRSPVDLLISTSSAAIKGLRPPAGVPHLCYCHAPARYVWSVRDEYDGGGRLTDLARAAGLAAYGGIFRAWDRRTAANVSTFLANSSHTAAEIQRCFGRTAHVVFPPVRTEFFTPDPSTPREDFWLFAGALEPYKRADLAAEAALAAGKRLVIVGSGSLDGALRARYEPRGVEFTGRVTDEQLRDLYRRARLLLFPQIEDFGITAVEAQACGCPVVARDRGGALDTVIAAETGSFFSETSAAAIAAATETCPADASACRANAERFAESVFDASMQRHIDAALSQSPRKPGPVRGA